jgi:hypothetical protein
MAARTGRRVVAATLSCCVLGLALLPAASAKRDHETSTTATASTPASTQTSTQTSTQADSPNTAATSTQPTETAPATKTKSRERSARASKGSTSAGAAGSPAEESSTGGSAGATARADGGREGRAAQRTRGKHSHTGGLTTATSETQGEGEGGSEVSPAAVSADARPGHGSGHKGKGHKKEEREAAGGSGKHGKGKGQESGGEGESKPEEKTTGTPPPLTASPPAEALTPAASAASVPSAATPVSAPTVHRPASGLSTPARAHRARRPRRGRRANTRALTAARAATPALAVAPALAAAAHRTRHVAAGHSPHGGGGNPVAPLVKTITKIVNVVPLGVRLLIAALFALALVLAARSRVSVARARRLERQRAELLDDVGLLQAALLPATPERVGLVGTSAAYQPAAGPGAGGDFYDVFELADGQLAVIVGDISGHGREALPHTALVRFTLRAYLEAGLAPRDALQTAGAVLEHQLGGVFATVAVALYQPRARVLVYACAGHPPPLVMGSQSIAHSLASVTIGSAPPIGVGMRTGTRQTTISLPGRAQVCFYTDGITEARIGSELFGAERLEDELSALGPQATAAELLEAIAERADARPDDMAACLLSVAGGDGAPRVLAEEIELDRSEASNPRTAGFLRACGVPSGEAAEAIRAASAAAGRASTVVLEVRRGERAAEVSLRRVQLAHLHARRTELVQGSDAEAAR